MGNLPGSSARWHVLELPVHFPRGGIVHAYPWAKVVAVNYDGGDRVWVTLLDRDAIGAAGKLLTRPNEEEVEFEVHFSLVEDLPEDVGSVAGVFQVEGSHFAAVYCRL